MARKKNIQAYNNYLKAFGSTQCKIDPEFPGVRYYEISFGPAKECERGHWNFVPGIGKIVVEIIDQ